MKIQAVRPIAASQTADLPDDPETPDVPDAAAILVTIVVDALTQATTEVVSASVAPARSAADTGARSVEVRVDVRHTGSMEDHRQAAPPPTKSAISSSAAPAVQPKMTASKSGTRGTSNGIAGAGDDGADDALVDTLVIQLATDLITTQPPRARGRGRRSGRMSAGDSGLGGIDGVDGAGYGDGADLLDPVAMMLLAVTVPKAPDPDAQSIQVPDGLFPGDFAGAASGFDETLVTFYRPPLHNRRLDTNGVDDALLLLTASLRQDPSLRSLRELVVPVPEPIKIDEFQQAVPHEEPLPQEEAAAMVAWYPDKAIGWPRKTTATTLASAAATRMKRQAVWPRLVQTSQPSAPSCKAVVECVAFWVRADTPAPAAAIAQLQADVSASARMVRCSHRLQRIARLAPHASHRPLHIACCTSPVLQRPFHIPAPFVLADPRRRWKRAASGSLRSLVSRTLHTA